MWGESNRPEYTALIAVTLMVTFNISSVIFLASSYLGNTVPSNNLEITVIVIYVISILIGYFVFVRSNHYVRFCSRYSNFDKVAHRKGTVMIMTYLLLSLVLLLVSVPV